MTPTEIGIIVTVALFFIGHLFAVSRFTARTTTQVQEITRCLRALEGDFKSLSKFDSKIETLHERMNQSQADRRELWLEVKELRKEVRN